MTFWNLVLCIIRWVCSHVPPQRRFTLSSHTMKLNKWLLLVRKELSAGLKKQSLHSSCCWIKNAWYTTSPLLLIPQTNTLLMPSSFLLSRSIRTLGWGHHQRRYWSKDDFGGSLLDSYILACRCGVSKLWHTMLNRKGQGENSTLCSMTTTPTRLLVLVLPVFW